MDKKIYLKILGSNICFFILTASAFITMSQSIYSVIDTINVFNAKGVFKFTLIKTTIYVTSSTYNKTYNIFNYIAIPIIVGIFLNIYFMIKIKKRVHE